MAALVLDNSESYNKYYYYTYSLGRQYRRL